MQRSLASFDPRFKGVTIPSARFHLDQNDPRCLDEQYPQVSMGIIPSYATRLFRLTLLAPDIVSAILSGKHPPDLTARKLVNDVRLPPDWNEQRRSLGFP